MITLNNRNALALVVSLLCVNNNAYSAEEQQPGILAAYTALMPSWADVTGMGYNLVTSSANSLVTTVTNHVSDDAAFAKLGFPPTNDINQAELAKFITIRNRHNEAILDNDNSAISLDDIAYLERRHVYCHRAINALPIHSQGIELATFILQNYQSVMNSFEIARLIQFMQMKKEESEQAVHDLNSQLNVIVTDQENNFAFSVLKQNNVAAQQQEGVQLTFDMSEIVKLLTNPTRQRIQGAEHREDQKEEKE